MAGLRRALSGAQLALGLLTVVPVRARTITGGLGPASGWFPLVGGLVGFVVGGIRLAADHPLGPALAAVLALIALVVLTGGLHQDGLADLADALGVRGGPERRLEVMRGSTLGTFGVLALVLWALWLGAAIAALPRHQVIKALLITGVLSRWAAVLHGRMLRPARPEGLGAAFVPGPLATGVATAVAFATLAAEPGPAAAALGGAILATAAVSLLAWRLLGGRTGDTLGASIALTEAVVLTVLAGLTR
jgi:adenosylcobinamide-GDP ribazoletransferase